MLGSYIERDADAAREDPARSDRSFAFVRVGRSVVRPSLASLARVSRGETTTTTTRDGTGRDGDGDGPGSMSVCPISVVCVFLCVLWDTCVMVVFVFVYV